MVVLEKELSKVYPEVDLVTTPSGDPVGMVHCNNCTSDLNAWVSVFKEFAETFGMEIGMDDLQSSAASKHWKGTKTAEDFSHTIISQENILQTLKKGARYLSGHLRAALISQTS